MDKNKNSNELADLKAKMSVYEQWQNLEASKQSYSGSETDFRELLNIIWLGKLQIIVITTVFSILSIMYALSLPNIYKSEALLMPNSQESQQSGLGALAGQLGGIASLAGISLGVGGADKTVYALQVLQSREFLIKFFDDNHLKVPIMATEGWDRNSETFKYIKGDYNPESNTWTRSVKPPLKPEPSMLETYEQFTSENLVISEDKDTGMIKLAVKHYSPILAKEILDKLIITLNNQIKNSDLLEAQNSVNYLKRELMNTTVAGLRAMFYQLIEQQQQTIMLTKVRDDYVLKVVDKGVVAEEKTEPSRSIIVIVFTILGFLLSIFYVLVKKLY